MILLGASTLLFDYKLAEVIPMMRDLGYDGVEIWHFHLERTREDIGKLSRLAEQYEALITVHALSWDLNYCSRLPDIREASLQALQKSIALSRDLGAKTVVVHPGRIIVPNDIPEANWPLLIEGTQKLVDYAESVDVTLSLEVMEHIPREFFIQPQDATYILEHITSPSFNITFDAAHVPYNIGLIDYFQAMPRVGHIHLSDCSKTKYHLPLGEGTRELDQFLQHLNNIKCTLPIVIEGLEFERTPQLAAKNKLQFDRWMNLIRET